MGGFEVSGQSLGCCYQVEVGEMGDPNRCQQPFIPRFRRSANHHLRNGGIATNQLAPSSYDIDDFVYKAIEG